MPSLNEDKKKEIVDALYWDSRVDASNITVTVDGTTATLSGTVGSFWESNIARDFALDVFGILTVDNQLIVKYVTTVPTDDEILTNIETTLLWTPAIDPSKIDVNVDVGIVTMKGEVDAYWKIYRAEELVSDLQGVIKIHNELAVVPTGSFFDADIAEQIVKSFEKSNLIDPDIITVKVASGNVTLTGTVSSWSAKELAAVKVRYIAGVVKVDNQIILAS